MKRLSIASIFLLVVTLACSISPVVSAPIVSPKPMQAKILATPLPVEITPTAVTAQVTANSLHVRTEPMGLRIGYLYKADTVTLTGSCRSGWAQIEWQGATAWVKASFLSENKCQKVTGT
jgi:uncharacterized protein YgiM (DUF1202 family)